MITFDQKPEYFQFVTGILGGNYAHGGDCKVLTKLHDDGSIACVVAYTRFSKTNLEMSIASDGSKTWVNRKFIQAAFAYPFLQLGKRRVLSIAHEDNHAVLDQDRRLGFVEEGRLRKWYGDRDGILFGMLREECIWLKGQ